MDDKFFAIVTTTQFKKLQNSILTLILSRSGKESCLGYMERNDLRQETLLACWLALPKFKGRPYPVRDEDGVVLRRWARRNGSAYAGKSTMVVQNVDVMTFLYRVMENRLIDLARRAQHQAVRLSTVQEPSCDIDVPLALSPVMLGLHAIPHGYLLLAQALGLTDKDLGLTATDRKRRERARAELARVLAPLW